MNNGAGLGWGVTHEIREHETPSTNENTVIPLYKMQLPGLFSLKLTYHSVLWRSCTRFPALGGRDSYESLPFPRYR